MDPSRLSALHEYNQQTLQKVRKVLDMIEQAQRQPKVRRPVPALTQPPSPPEHPGIIAQGLALLGKRLAEVRQEVAEAIKQGPKTWKRTATPWAIDTEKAAEVAKKAKTERQALETTLTPKITPSSKEPPRIPWAVPSYSKPEARQPLYPSQPQLRLAVPPVAKPKGTTWAGKLRTPEVHEIGGIPEGATELLYWAGIGELVAAASLRHATEALSEASINALVEEEMANSAGLGAKEVATREAGVKSIAAEYTRRYGAESATRLAQKIRRGEASWQAMLSAPPKEEMPKTFLQYWAAQLSKDKVKSDLKEAIVWGPLFSLTFEKRRREEVYERAQREAESAYQRLQAETGAPPPFPKEHVVEKLYRRYLAQEKMPPGEYMRELSKDVASNTATFFIFNPALRLFLGVPLYSAPKVGNVLANEASKAKSSLDEVAKFTRETAAEIKAGAAKITAPAGRVLGSEAGWVRLPKPIKEQVAAAKKVAQEASARARKRLLQQVTAGIEQFKNAYRIYERERAIRGLPADIRDFVRVAHAESALRQFAKPGVFEAYDSEMRLATGAGLRDIVGALTDERDIRPGIKSALARAGISEDSVIELAHMRALGWRPPENKVIRALLDEDILPKELPNLSSAYREEITGRVINKLQPTRGEEANAIRAQIEGMARRRPSSAMRQALATFGLGPQEIDEIARLSKINVDTFPGAWKVASAMRAAILAPKGSAGQAVANILGIPHSTGSAIAEKVRATSAPETWSIYNIRREVSYESLVGMMMNLFGVEQFAPGDAKVFEAAGLSRGLDELTARWLLTGDEQAAAEVTSAVPKVLEAVEQAGSQYDPQYVRGLKRRLHTLLGALERGRKIHPQFARAVEALAPMLPAGSSPALVGAINHALGTDITVPLQYTTHGHLVKAFYSAPGGLPANDPAPGLFGATLEERSKWKRFAKWCAESGIEEFSEYADLDFWDKFDFRPSSWARLGRAVVHWLSSAPDNEENKVLLTAVDRASRAFVSNPQVAVANERALWLFGRIRQELQRIVDDLQRQAKEAATKQEKRNLNSQVRQARTQLKKFEEFYAHVHGYWVRTGFNPAEMVRLAFLGEEEIGKGIAQVLSYSLGGAKYKSFLTSKEGAKFLRGLLLRYLPGSISGNPAIPIARTISAYWHADPEWIIQAVADETNRRRLWSAFLNAGGHPGVMRAAEMWADATRRGEDGAFWYTLFGYGLEPEEMVTRPRAKKGEEEGAAVGLNLPYLLQFADRLRDYTKERADPFALSLASEIREILEILSRENRQTLRGQLVSDVCGAIEKQGLANEATKDPLTERHRYNFWRLVYETARLSRLKGRRLENLPDDVRAGLLAKAQELRESLLSATNEAQRLGIWHEFIEARAREGIPIEAIRQVGGTLADDLGRPLLLQSMIKQAGLPAGVSPTQLTRTPKNYSADMGAVEASIYRAGRRTRPTVTAQTVIDYIRSITRVALGDVYTAEGTAVYPYGSAGTMIGITHAHDVYTAIHELAHVAHHKAIVALTGVSPANYWQVADAPAVQKFLAEAYEELASRGFPFELRGALGVSEIREQAEAIAEWFAARCLGFVSALGMPKTEKTVREMFRLAGMPKAYDAVLRLCEDMMEGDPMRKMLAVSYPFAGFLVNRKLSALDRAKMKFMTMFVDESYPLQMLDVYSRVSDRPQGPFQPRTLREAIEWSLGWTSWVDAAATVGIVDKHGVVQALPVEMMVSMLHDLDEYAQCVSLMTAEATLEMINRHLEQPYGSLEELIAAIEQSAYAQHKEVAEALQMAKDKLHATVYSVLGRLTKDDAQLVAEMRRAIEVALEPQADGVIPVVATAKHYAEDAEKMQRFRVVIEEYKKYVDALLRMMRDSGFVTEGEAQTMAAAWPLYFRLIVERAQQNRIPKGPVRLATIPHIERRLGTQRFFLDPFESLVEMTALTFRAVSRNNLFAEVARCVEEAAEQGDAPYLMKKMELGAEVAVPPLAQRLFADLTPEGVLYVWQDGRPVAYHIEPSLIQAFQTFFKTADMEGWHVFILSNLAQFVRRMILAGPGYMIFNLMRDLTMLAMGKGLSGVKRYPRGAKAVAMFSRFLLDAKRSLHGAKTEAELREAVRNVFRRYDGFLNQAEMRAILSYLGLGGMSRQLAGIEVLRGRHLDPAMIMRSSAWWRLRDWALHPTYSLLRFSSALEAIPRVAAVTESYEEWPRRLSANRRAIEEAIERVKAEIEKAKGTPRVLQLQRRLYELQSRLGLLAAEEKEIKEGTMPNMYPHVIAGQEATIHFGHGGTVTKNINALVAFFNANIREIARCAQILKENPKAALAVLSLFATAKLIEYLRYSDEAWYDGLSEEEKTAYLHVKVPGTDNVLRLPAPSTFAYLAHAAITSALSQAPDKWDKVRRSIKMIIPDPVFTGVLPILEILTNRTVWGSVIIPRSLQYEEPYWQLTGATSPASIVLGRKIGVAPAYVETIVRGYGGEIGRYALQTASLFFGEQERGTKASYPAPGVGLEDLPVLSRFFLTTTKPPVTWSQLYTARDYYERELKKAKQEAIALMRQGVDAETATLGIYPISSSLSKVEGAIAFIRNIDNDMGIVAEAASLKGVPVADALERMQWVATRRGIEIPPDIWNTGDRQKIGRAIYKELLEMGQERARQVLEETGYRGPLIPALRPLGVTQSE